MTSRYDPRYWDDKKRHEETDQWEQYWRAGYQVGNLTPVVVNDYCRGQQSAEKEAQDAATEARAKLDEVYFEDDVTPWTQHWRVRNIRQEDAVDRELMEPMKSRMFQKKRGTIKRDLPTETAG